MQHTADVYASTDWLGGVAPFISPYILFKWNT